MTTSSRIAALVGCALLASAAIGCGSEPSEEPGFSPYPNSPLRVRTQEYTSAAGATSRVEVGPWDPDPSIVELYGKKFALVSVESNNPEVIPNEFILSDGMAHRQFVTFRALDRGSARLRVQGSVDPSTRAYQSVRLSTREPHDAKIHFYACPEDIERPIFVSDGDPVSFAVTAHDADGELLAGHLDREIALVGPNGETPAIEPSWIENLPVARSTFVPPASGVYTIELERFGRTATFEVVSADAADDLGTRVCDSGI